MLDPTRPFVLVPFWDPAIDFDSPKTDLDLYLLTADVSHLFFKKGKRPMQVHCRPIANGFTIRRLQGASEGDARILAFQSSVWRVDAPRLRDGRNAEHWYPQCVMEQQSREGFADGQAQPPSFKTQELLVGFDDLDIFDNLLVTWVGEVCRVAAEVPIGVEPRFALPDSCARLLGSHPDLSVGLTLSRLRRGLITLERAKAMLEPLGLSERLGDATAMDAATGSEAGKGRRKSKSGAGPASTSSG